MIQCDHHKECQKPDIIVEKMEEKELLIIGIAIPDAKENERKEDPDV